MEAASLQRVSPAGPIPLRLRSDAALARAAAAGREDAFAAIFRRYQQPLYRYCCSLLRSEADASDALQNTMLAAMRSLPGEGRSIELKPWLYRVAHNESISLMRRRRPQEELDDRLPALSGDPAASAEQRADFRQLMSDLGELSEAQRSALLLRELSGLSYEEIASAFEISLSATKQSIHKARSALQQMAEGRQMRCEEIEALLSERDGRLIKGRGIRAHLRSCSHCHDFNSAISGREVTLQAVMPALAVPAAAKMFASVFGGSSQGGGSGGLAALVGGGKLAGSTAAVKAIAVGAAAISVGAGGLGVTAALDVDEKQGLGAMDRLQESAAHPSPGERATEQARNERNAYGATASGQERPGRAGRADGAATSEAESLAAAPPAAQGASPAPAQAPEAGTSGGGDPGTLPTPPSAPSAPGATASGSSQTGTEQSEGHVPESPPVPPQDSQPPSSQPPSPTPAPVVELPPVAPTGGGSVVGPPVELPGGRP